MFWWKKKQQNIADPAFREFKFSELKPGEVYHAEGILPQYKGRSVKHVVILYDLQEIERIQLDAGQSAEAKKMGVSLHVQPGFKQAERNKEFFQLAHRAERRSLTKQLIWDLFFTAGETHCVKIVAHNGAYTSTLLHINVNLDAVKLPPGLLRQQVVQGKTGEQWVGINIKTMRSLSKLLLAPYENAMRLQDPSGEDDTVILNASELLVNGNLWTQHYWVTAFIRIYLSFVGGR